MATVRPILRLGKCDEGRPVSSGEFAEAGFDEPWKYEREDGRLIVMGPAGEGHSDVSEEWRDRLGAYRLDRPEIVRRVASEAWIRVDGGTDRIPDIGIYLASDRPTPPRPDRVPDLIFEVVSPGKSSRDRDYLRKRAEYSKLGVKEYVIIDRFKRIVTVLTLATVDYEERVLAVDQSYESPLLPGLSIRLSDVF